MATAELALRLVAATQFLVLAAVMGLQRPRLPENTYGMLLFLGVASYLLAPLVLWHWHWGVPGYPVLLLASLVPVFLWLFSQAVFNDGFRPHVLHWLALLVTTVLGLAWIAVVAGLQPLAGMPGAHYLQLPAQGAKFLWLAAAFFTVTRDWRNDLVAPRRRLRLLLVVGAGLYMAVVLVVELVAPQPVPPGLETLNVALITTLAVSLVVHLLALDGTSLFARMRAVPERPAELSPLARQLQSAMTSDRVYMEEGLTITELATRLRTQEHRLRPVINGELGYRNFNEFINCHRVEEVASRLVTEADRDIPVLTLALDAGFRSLAPFNRAFKERFGVTPSAYRAREADKNTN